MLPQMNIRVKGTTGLIIAAVIGFLVMATLFVVGFIPRLHTNAELTADAETAANGAISSSTPISTSGTRKPGWPRRSTRWWPKTRTAPAPWPKAR